MKHIGSLKRTMRILMLYWFKMQGVKAVKLVLTPYFKRNELPDILQNYWKRYLAIRPGLPQMPTLGSSLMIHLSGMSTAFYHELLARGVGEETATQLFYDIAWKVYQKMGRVAWRIAGWGNRYSHDRLLTATRLFRAFPFNEPAYLWKNVKTDKNVVGFYCVKCPVAEYFQNQGLDQFCVNTWCALDFPLAEMWDAKLERKGSKAGGAVKCDFRWIAKQVKNKIPIK